MASPAPDVAVITTHRSAPVILHVDCLIAQRVGAGFGMAAADLPEADLLDHPGLLGDDGTFTGLEGGVFDPSV